MLRGVRYGQSILYHNLARKTLDDDLQLICHSAKIKNQKFRLSPSRRNQCDRLENNYAGPSHVLSWRSTPMNQDFLGSNISKTIVTDVVLR